NFSYVPGSLPSRSNELIVATSTNRPQLKTAEVRNGIDVLVKQEFVSLKGLRVGLISNHTGHDRERNPTIDLLKNAPNVQLKVLFSPEHGIRGMKDESVGD